MTFEQFKAHLEELHQREIKAGFNEGHMMYNCPEDLGDNAFAYSYDALCRQVLRFNEDGTVSEWCEAAENDHEYYEAHFTHASIEEWMQAQIQAVKMPEIA